MLILDFGDISNIRSISPLKEFDLNGLIISIRLFYNTEDDKIYMNVYDINDNVIANGIKLIPNVNLVAKHNYKFKSDFNLIIMSADEDKFYDEVTMDNFGKSMVMIYAEDVESD